MKKNVFFMVMMSYGLIESLYAMDQNSEEISMQPGNEAMALPAQIEPEMSYEKYHHILFPDDIVDLIVREKQLYNECVDQKLLSIERSKLQSKSNMLDDQQHLMAYVDIYNRKKQYMTPEQWKEELKDFAAQLKKNILGYEKKLETAAEGFFEVTPSQVRLANRSYIEGQALVAARDRRTVVKKLWEGYAPWNWQQYVQVEGPAVVEKLQKVVDQYCTLENAQNIAGQGLNSLGYGMRIACRLMVQAQQALKEAAEAEARKEALRLQ